MLNFNNTTNSLGQDFLVVEESQPDRPPELVPRAGSIRHVLGLEPLCLPAHGAVPLQPGPLVRVATVIVGLLLYWVQ